MIFCNPITAQAAQVLVFRCNMLPYSGFIFTTLSNQIFQKEEVISAKLAKLVIAILHGLLLIPNAISSELYKWIEEHYQNEARKRITFSDDLAVEAFLNEKPHLRKHFPTLTIIKSSLPLLKRLLVLDVTNDEVIIIKQLFIYY